MVYPEFLSEEFNRFGVQFRGWRDEYTIVKADNIEPEYSEALDRVYRVQLINNCLEPGKWEVVVDSEDYSDFSERRKSDNNLNQRRILAHSWFNLPMDFYKTLLKINNPELETDLINLGYNELTAISEKTPIDFNQLREPLDEKLDIEIIEIGHQSKRVIEILDPEEYYKKKFGLVLSEDSYTYESILNQRLPLTRFQDRGFYSREKADSFYVQWLKYVDDVEINTIEVHDVGVILEIKLTGENAPYEIVLGNVDPAIMNEQILCGFLFGVNTYITNVRNNSRPSTIVYDPTQYPSYRRPYLYLIDKKTGNWVNNQFKGVEKIYISYDDIDREILNIYVLSYERIVPVWMARVRLPDDFVEQIRVRRRLFNY
jgi:metal-sulfur cluster biosynthetic enzyme